MWDESKCNRDEAGRFAEKSGGGYSKRQIELARQRLAQGIKKRAQPEVESERKMFVDIQLFAVDYKKMKTRELQKAKKSFDKRIAEHDNKIKYPNRIYKDWNNFDEGRKAREINHWEHEKENWNNQISLINNELKRRGIRDE